MQRTTPQPRSIQRSVGENCAKLRKRTQEHRKPSKKTTTSPKSSPRTTKRAKELRTPPNKLRANSSKTSPHRSKTQTNGIKRELTERNSSKQRAMVTPAHNHAENFENLQELTLWMGASFTRPHAGRLMILPVDQNAGDCLVKGSTCAPLRTSVPLRDPPQEPAKKQSSAAAADRTSTPKSVTVSPNTKRTRTVQILSHSQLYNSQA